MANTAQDEAECCICTRPHPEYCILYTAQVNDALTDLLFCIGRISSNHSDGFGQANRSNSLLPQEYEMEYIKYCIPANLCYTTLHNDKSLAMYNDYDYDYD